MLEEHGPAFLDAYRLPLLTYEEAQELKRSSAPALDAPGALQDALRCVLADEHAARGKLPSKEH